MKTRPKNSDKKSDRELLKQIYNISYLLTQSPDLDTVLNEIVDHVIIGLKYDRAIVMLLNEDETRLECRGIRGFTSTGEKRAWEKPLVLDLHDCYETKVVRSGKPLFIPDIARDPGITEIDRIIAKYQERKSFLHVPLKVKDKVLGTIGVDRYRTKMRISQKEVEDLAIFANQAAIIIENARLYKELKDEKLLSENIIRSSINGIIVSDLHGKVILINPRAEEILGISCDKAAELHLHEIFSSDIGRIYKKLITKESSHHYEIQYQRKDGNKLILDIAPFSLEEKGKSSKAVLLINDLTEKRRIDDHLIRVEKFAALGSMAAGIAHEIRNPLAAIFTTIQNVEMKLERGSPNKFALQNVTKELDRIEHLIRELLNAMNPVPLHMEKVDVIDLLQRALFFVKKKAGGKNSDIKFELGGEKRVYTKADSNRLMQVFLNIMINSVESIRKKGKVQVNVKKIKERDPGNQFISIRFTDNGAGISPSLLTKIFDPFFTTKSGGTGLGLTVSHKIIQDHNGIIEIDSEERKGTNVLVKLPLVK